ncbi:MAG: isoprenylcysteine carboxylmethyltransferase family protein [Candidatus Bathyarchaeota archaeon]|nr:MAG: isoprenylcysteine carboxylmethyltransferase family protein [Candidatus Bathyarchaeota archaeon]
MSMNKKVIFFVIFFIFSVISSMLGLGYLVTLVLGLPFDLPSPAPIRLLGLLATAVGVFFAGWTLRYRKPSDIILSSYATVMKAVKRIDVEERVGRSESLVILGPYKYVRNPQYFGVVMLLFGLGALLSFTFLFFASLFTLLWFRFVLIPFEERELLSLFGAQYETYMKQVPAIFPSLLVWRVH